jgi:hypothetical protein
MLFLHALSGQVVMYHFDNKKVTHKKILRRKIWSLWHDLCLLWYNRGLKKLFQNRAVFLSSYRYDWERPFEPSNFGKAAIYKTILKRYLGKEYI